MADRQDDRGPVVNPHEAGNYYLAMQERLFDLSKGVLASKNVPDLLQTVVDAARVITGARVGNSGYCPKGRILVGTSSREHGYPECPSDMPFHSLRGGFYLELLRRAESIRFTDRQMRAHPRWQPLPEGHVPLRGLLGVRLTDSEGNANGIVTVSDKKGGEFTERDELYLKQLASIASLGLQHIEAKNEVQKHVGELVESQLSLEKAKAKTTSIVESITDAFVSLDRDFRITYINQMASELLHQEDRDELLGKIIWDICPEAVDSIFFKEYADSLKNNVPKHFEEYYEPFETWFEVYCYPYPDGLNIFFNNINERKKTERQLRELNDNLESLVQERTKVAERRTQQLRALAAELTRTEQRERRRLAQILHDHLQQLLVAAQFSVVSVAKKIQDPEAAEKLEMATEILSDSIEASRSLTAELSPPILYEAGLIPALRWLLKWNKDHHELQVQFEPGQEIFIEDQYLRVTVFSIIRELLLNVIKHSGVHRASLSVFRDRHENLKVIVSDEGKGFDVAKQQEAAAKESFGLFSISERVDLIGGIFDVQAKPGHGATVTITIPKEKEVERLSPKVGKEDEDYVEALKKEPGKINILIADDHKLLREGLIHLLSGQQDIHVIAQVSDGKQAVRQTELLHPDVVLMDITMPKMDGIKATKMIKEKASDVRVIGLTMHDHPDMVNAMLYAGAEKCLAKDGAFDSLVETIKTFA